MGSAGGGVWVDLESHRREPVTDHPPLTLDMSTLPHTHTKPVEFKTLVQEKIKVQVFISETLGLNKHWGLIMDINSISRF